MNIYQVIAVERKKGEICSIIIDIKTVLAEDVEAARTSFILANADRIKKAKGVQIIVHPFYEP